MSLWKVSKQTELTFTKVDGVCKLLIKKECKQHSFVRMEALEKQQRTGEMDKNISKDPGVPG